MPSCNSGYVHSGWPRPREFSRRFDCGHKFSYLDSTAFRLCNKLEKINSNTTTTAGISRIQHQLSRVNIGITTGQSPENSRRVSTITSGATGSARRLAKLIGKLTATVPGGIASPSTLSTAANVEDKSTASRQPKLWHQDRSERAMSRRVNVVDTLPHRME